MPAYILDTSALAKRYHPEDGTAAVDRLFGDENATIQTPRLGLVELCSALSIKFRTGTITGDELDHCWRRVLSDVERGALRVLRLLPRHFTLAEFLLRRYAKQHRLRSLDAIHLAVAIDSIRNGHADVFVTADALLEQLSRQEGFATRNPLAWDVDG